MAQHLQFPVIALWVKYFLQSGELFGLVFFKNVFICFWGGLFAFLISRKHAFYSISTPWSPHCKLEYVWLFIFKVTLLWFLFNIETMNQAPPARKLEEVLHLAELCIEVLQQNEEHHAEVMTCFTCPVKLPIMLCRSGNSTEVPCP